MSVEVSKLTILGGCGSVGGTAARTLTNGDYFDEMVLADYRYDEVAKLAEELGPKVSAAKVDANDPESIKSVVSGSDVVLNCVGPFYKFGPKILSAVIDAGINYVDVCDDLDPTITMLDMDSKAKEAGVSALVGMGSSPGVANVIVKFIADSALDQLEVADLYHIHGGEAVEGPAVVKHRIHSMEIEIPAYLDGKLETMRLLDDKYKALSGECEFREFGVYPVYPYPHPETITLPRYIPGVKRVTNLGIVAPREYYELIMQVVHLGLTTAGPLEVGGNTVNSLEFSVAFLLKKREELIKKAGVKSAFGCLKVVMKGKKDGRDETFNFYMFSSEKGMGEGTGIPAAMGAIMMGRGQISEKGVFPPEAGVNPGEFIKLLPDAIKGMGMGEGLPIAIEHIDSEGKVTTMDIPV